MHKVKLHYLPNQPKDYYKYAMNAIKYLPLIPKGSNMVPITNSYVRDQTIDTSPSAHILVMAQAENNGILVYKYNPQNPNPKTNLGTRDKVA